MTAPDAADGGIAAFFDLDGTLVPPPSLERRLFSVLRKAWALPAFNYLRWAVEAVRLSPQGVIAIQQNDKRYLTGLTRELMLRHFESISFFDEGIARVAWHAQHGHHIAIASGTLQPLAEMAAMALECELEARSSPVKVRVVATQLREISGQWTGYLAGEAIFGEAKARAAQRVASSYGWDLRNCHAYGNDVQDRQLLCAVGHAHTVNAGKRMAALANEKDWPIWHWHDVQRIATARDTHPTKQAERVEETA